MAADILPPGTVCRLAGLSAANLNGAAATVEELDANKMRYAVTLVDGQTISVKPSNLRQVISDARVVGTSKEELNGKVAASATYDSTSGRYVCEGLKADGTSISLKPENLILPPECRVTIEGVTSRPGLNGKVGRVAGVERDRYVVQLPDNERGEAPLWRGRRMLMPLYQSSGQMLDVAEWRMRRRYLFVLGDSSV